MNNEMKCLRCGSKNVRPSEVQSTGRIYSRPRQATLSAVLLTGALVSGLTCLDCGHVELLVDVNTAKSMVRTQ
jgi:predicted nucleic-acid-binding Zn-ribbon protein